MKLSKILLLILFVPLLTKCSYIVKIFLINHTTQELTLRIKSKRPFTPLYSPEILKINMMTNKKTKDSLEISYDYFEKIIKIPPKSTIYLGKMSYPFRVFNEDSYAILENDRLLIDTLTSQTSYQKRWKYKSKVVAYYEVKE
jgi:hypothetical protein